MLETVVNGSNDDHSPDFIESDIPPLGVDPSSFELSDTGVDGAFSCPAPRTPTVVVPSFGSKVEDRPNY